MSAESRLARVFGLDDRGWTRHANPWSGWTRVTCLPLLALAIWSREWLGWWSLAPIALALAWIFVNPRAFGPARDDRAWMTRGVFGERLWSNRGKVPVPERHRVVPNVLNVVSLVGVVVLVWGLVALDVWPTLLGMTITVGAKLWFMDRMVTIYHDMAAATPALRYRGPPVGPGKRMGPGKRVGPGKKRARH